LKGFRSSLTGQADALLWANNAAAAVLCPGHHGHQPNRLAGPRPHPPRPHRPKGSDPWTAAPPAHSGSPGQPGLPRPSGHARSQSTAGPLCLVPGLVS
jgi:hypothetical protein